jgi:hypothetical protein
MGYRNPLKQAVTSSQIIQFILNIIHSILLIVIEPHRVCTVFEFMYSLLLLKLFLTFWNETYPQKGFVTGGI